MKRKLFILSMLTLFLGLSTSIAIACNCGKKVDSKNQTSSCQSQCAGGCGGQAACSDGSLQLARGTTQQDNKGDESKVVEVGNKICPVSGEKIGSMGEGIKIKHEGKVYNLCCPGCERKFKEDPAKYIGVINKELKGSTDSKETYDHEGHDHSSQK